MTGTAVVPTIPSLRNKFACFRSSSPSPPLQLSSSMRAKPHPHRAHAVFLNTLLWWALEITPGTSQRTRLKSRAPAVERWAVSFAWCAPTSLWRWGRLSLNSEYQNEGCGRWGGGRCGSHTPEAAFLERKALMGCVRVESQASWQKRSLYFSGTKVANLSFRMGKIQAQQEVSTSPYGLCIYLCMQLHIQTPFL